ncbi:MAG: hypothetical protein K940chlam8_00124 [Chlamydiae bacterium]|nr:hypothetical protein [Chlamydiota bacterium]
MSGIEVIAYQSAVLSHNSAKLGPQPLTEHMRLQLRASESTQALYLAVQRAYPQGAKVCISSRGIEVLPSKAEAWQAFDPDSSLVSQVLEETKALRMENFEQLALRNLEKASSDYTQQRVFKPINSRTSNLTSKIVSFVKGILGYTPAPKVIGQALGTANYLSGARYAVETAEAYRDFRNAKRLGDVRLMSEKAFSGVTSALACVNSVSSATQSVGELSGVVLPAVVGSVASVISFLSSLLFAIYSGYELFHETRFSYGVMQARRKGTTEETQAKHIWKYFQKRVKVDVEEIRVKVHQDNQEKTVKELRQEVSKLHKRLIPFNLKFDRAQKRELFEQLEFHVEQMMQTTKVLQFPEREQGKALLNYMVLLESEIQRRKVDQHLAFHTGADLVSIMHKYENIDEMGEDGIAKVLAADKLIYNQSVYKISTLSIALALSALSLTAALLAVIAVACPGVLPAIVVMAIPMMDAVAAGGFMLYAAQSLIYKVQFNTFNDEIKEVFEKGVKKMPDKDVESWTQYVLKRFKKERPSVDLSSPDPEIT